jgi:hypothetical protein
VVKPGGEGMGAVEGTVTVTPGDFTLFEYDLLA